MLIYNLFPTLSGRFTDWTPHMRRAASMGFDWLFINPVQYPGFSGSLYSINDYFGFNPLVLDHGSSIAPEEQFGLMAREARAMGLRLISDLVVNHTAIDSPLVHEHPQWFCRDKSGEVLNPHAMDGQKKVIWGDLAKLDHEGTADKEGLYGYFRGVVRYLIGLGIEGFRCDAAYQVPVEFWRRLIDEIHAEHPGIVFAAETLGCSVEDTVKTASAGFDYIFNSSKWWDFQSPWLMEQYALTSPLCPSISFPESHDTERLASQLNGNASGLRRNYLFSALFSAGVMITQGFEHGFTKRLDVVRTRPSDMEKPGPDLVEFITSINSIKKSYPDIFLLDLPTQLYEDPENPSIVLMKKHSPSGSARALVAINRDIESPRRLKAADIGSLAGINGAACFFIAADETSPSSSGTIAGGLDIMLKPGGGAIFLPGPQKGISRHCFGAG